MAITFEGLVGRAIMAATPEERAEVERMTTLLLHAQRSLCDFRSIVVIDGGSDGSMCVPAARWDRDVPRATKDDIAARGWVVIDGRHYTRDGRVTAAARKAGLA